MWWLLPVALVEMWWETGRRGFSSLSPGLHAAKQNGQERAFGVMQPKEPRDQQTRQFKACSLLQQGKFTSVPQRDRRTGSGAPAAPRASPWQILHSARPRFTSKMAPASSTTCKQTGERYFLYRNLFPATASVIYHILYMKRSLPTYFTGGTNSNTSGCPWESSGYLGGKAAFVCGLSNTVLL